MIGPDMEALRTSRYVNGVWGSTSVRCGGRSPRESYHNVTT